MVPKPVIKIPWISGGFTPTHPYFWFNSHKFHLTNLGENIFMDWRHGTPSHLRHSCIALLTRIMTGKHCLRKIMTGRKGFLGQLSKVIPCYHLLIWMGSKNSNTASQARSMRSYDLTSEQQLQSLQCNDHLLNHTHRQSQSQDLEIIQVPFVTIDTNRNPSKRNPTNTVFCHHKNL